MAGKFKAKYHALAERELGMSMTSARTLLRKQIMLSMARKLHEDVCFKCGIKIEIAEELSIEHKKFWLHVSSELFWDLDNIAFSHRKCNTPDRPGGRPPIIRPSGFNWCCRCKEFFPISDFYKDSARVDGLQNRCKNCKREYQRIRQGVKNPRF